jgi:hypothetical protein
MGLRWGRWGVVSMARDISGCVFRVLTGVFDLAAFGPTMLLLVVYISVSAVTAAWGFALTARHFFQTPKKYPKRLAPSVRPLAWARRSFAPVSIRGHCPPVCFATTYMQRVRLRRTALRATPRMHTSTQPPDGAGGSRSRAAGELTLGLLSGEGQKAYLIPCGSRACSR